MCACVRMLFNALNTPGMCFCFYPDDNLNQESPVQPSISPSVIQPHTPAFTGIQTQPLHTLLRLLPGTPALILLCDLYF